MTALFGLAMVGTSLTAGPKVVPKISAPVVNGQCALLNCEGSNEDPQIRISADFLGMVPLFYGSYGVHFFVSNRLHLLVLALEDAGYTVDLDIGSVASMFLVDSSIGMQLSVRRTPLKGISLLGTQESILITRQGGKVLTQPCLPDEQLTPNEYYGLIKRGAEEVALNVQAAIDSGLGSPVCTLTGGRDSRMILAAVMALGRLKDVRFATTAIHQEDVDVATGLVRFFGGAYGSSVPSGYTTATSQEALQRYRSRFFGLYHELQLQGLVQPVFDAPTIRMVGGCGELYRDFYQPKFPNDSHLSFSKANIDHLVE
ncbi:hypothetical protein [Falsiroseomonas tokyonensis]|nr:hypothetical protein [Falsiroseomonas tokyonensis]